MKIEQIYTGCIAHAAYYIECNGEAAIVDPLREVEPYMARAQKDGAQIKYVFETHFHADFVSGHLDLAAKTGAQIVYGPTAQPGFEALVARDGQEFKVGDCTIKAIHTPGHTLESTCYLVSDANGKPHGLISGDTLFIGDVGRPDLAQHVIADLTQDKLARMLYHSLRDKIMPLPDDVIVYPNHGAGSACGKMMRKETTDTLGNQKRTNYALNPALTEDEFVAALLNGLTTPPGYFPKNVLMNLQGYESLDLILDRAQQPLTPEEFAHKALHEHAIMLDVRSAGDFANGFIPGSINIGIDGNFAMWVGEMIADIQQPILLIADPDKEVEALIRLSRVGYDRTIGYLEGGFNRWKQAGKPVETVDRISAEELKNRLNTGIIPVIDVRKKSEFDSEHLVGAVNIPMNELYKRLDEIPKDEPFVLHCAGGYRSMIAASILKQLGWNNFVDVSGGFAEIKQSQLPVTEYVCPSTLL
ncbi:MAG: MBL fold metallo-hydrolase [Bacteroidetes bacterium]|nr:MBL fold metallo-hydrolase [Bacteroidota bacterium]